MTTMGIGLNFRHWSLALGSAAMLTASSLLASAQSAPPADKPEEPGFFSSIGQWFDQQVTGAKNTFDNFGREAGIAARTTADTAKDAADTLTRNLSATTVVSGHAVCRVAPNGAPDCVVAAEAICKAKGFKSGKSLDMTTAENCPAKVYMAGRSTGPGCTTETFVSSALCQ
jgi:hypothetical protein